MTVFDLHKNEIIEIYKKTNNQRETYRQIKLNHKEITIGIESFKYFFKTRIKNKL